ncbi:peroxisome membrane protein [Kockovaella imperatae]|uniref:Peroxisomal membrane protein PEX16 n=1 Tax=Kockovaella imperatae TaxID=4999 RepID=A0A1Y1UNB2_9TREE|nr:peroxisome membrane protein [Kockovaella imperatae]ORX38615.1 peroxisome membrane protein [Kockovaella imperatae]
MPSSLVEQYESLLLSNLSAIQSIESGLRNVTWFLPGRFEDAEVASEGLYALLNIVSGYHDTLLSKHLDPSLSHPPHPFEERPPVEHTTTAQTSPVPVASTSRPPRIAPVLPPLSDHSRYTRYWTGNSPTYRKASRILVTIQYVQLLVEMLSKKRSDRRRWRVLLGLESVKMLLKLIIMGITKRPVLATPAPMREYDIFSLPESVLRKSGSSSGATALNFANSPSSNVSNVPAVSQLPPHAPLRSHLLHLSSSLPESHLPDPSSLVPSFDSAGYLTSELIQVSLVWVHMALLMRASRQTQYRPSSLPSLSSWTTPYLIPLLLALLARRLRLKPTDSALEQPSLLLAEHYAQQDRRLAMRALLTGPVWIGWTRPKIMRVVSAVERIPVIGMVGGLMEGYLSMVDDYLFYTST